MKKKLIPILLSFSLFSSCVYEDENTVEKKIINFSSQNITINAYRFGELRLNKEVLPGEIILHEKQTSKGNNKGDYPNFRYDSIILINKEKQKIKYYVYQQIDSNQIKYTTYPYNMFNLLTDLDNYKVISEISEKKKFKDKYFYSYEITDDLFQ